MAILFSTLLGLHAEVFDAEAAGALEGARSALTSPGAKLATVTGCAFRARQGDPHYHVCWLVFWVFNISCTFDLGTSPFLPYVEYRQYSAITLLT